MLLCEQLHVVEGVLVISSSVVRHDRDCADTNLAQCLGLRDDATDARLHIWAVIADEDNKHALRPAHLGKRISFSVHALARFLTEFANVAFK